ncbi:UNVERIFIED_CONTAM: glyoxylase-like metal-dependent hydrolase (beta-lactamase superfamily II) [Brevibacillus sp. OAP136]
MAATYAPIMVGERTGFFAGSVNIGILLGETGAILIDSGLDTQNAKKLKKGLDEIGQKLVAIVQTHAHADHFGGNAYLLGQFPDAVVYAPELEEAMIRNPLLEPIYLGMGVSPLKELKNKFLLAESSRVDHILPSQGTITIDGMELELLALPGHSYNQIGIAAEGICYAADSFFGEETLKKHKLPFLVDARETLHSLAKLQATNYEGYLPGHGSFETSVDAVLEANIRCHKELLDRIEALYSTEATLEEGLMHICNQLEIKLDNLSGYVLFRTAFMGYLVGLLQEERITYRFVDNQLRFSSTRLS